MEIEAAKMKLLVEHYGLMKELHSWVCPDDDMVEEMERRISTLAKMINALDEVQVHVGETQ